MHPCADDIAAHHAAGTDHRKTGVFLLRGLCHFDHRICHTEQTIFADILRRFACGQQTVALVFQPGKAALHSLYTGLRPDFFPALRSQTGNFSTRRESKAQFDPHTIHSLSGVEIGAGAKSRDLTHLIAEQQVRRTAGNMEQQNFFSKQLFPLGCKQCCRSVTLLMGGPHKRDALCLRKEVDEIIVARGGGSREDLWVFNAEVIARAAYRCKKPLISAIGHEIDYTILDFVADRRAPTPSAAAELAVPDREEQKRILLDLQQNIRKNMQNRLDLCYNGLEQYNFVLEQGPARQSWQKKHDLLQQAKDEIRQQMQTQQNDAELQLQHAAALAGSLNPYKVLARGYAMVTAANGAILDAEGLQPEKTIYVRSVSHRAKCRVEAVEEINENTQKF